MEFSQSNFDLDSIVRDKLTFMLLLGAKIHDRIQVIWMSSDFCVDATNIIHVLPADVLRTVCQYF
jgi:hypothetical protein